MRRHGFAAVTITLVVLGNLGALLVQVSPRVAERAHALVVTRSLQAQAATADALQPDAVVLALPSPHAPWSHAYPRRAADPWRHHAARRPHRILLVPVYAWHPTNGDHNAFARRPRAGTRKTRREQTTASVAMMQKWGFAPWVIDVYMQAARGCKMLPHEVVKLVATRAAQRMVERRMLDERGGAPEAD